MEKWGKICALLADKGKRERRRAVVLFLGTPRPLAYFWGESGKLQGVAVLFDGVDVLFMYAFMQVHNGISVDNRTFANSVFA